MARHPVTSFWLWLFGETRRGLQLLLCTWVYVRSTWEARGISLSRELEAWVRSNGRIIHRGRGTHYCIVVRSTGIQGRGKVTRPLSITDSGFQPKR